MFDERMIYPSHSGIVTYLRAPYKQIEELREGEIAVLGVPFDTTLGSKPGARNAPREIREQTIHSIYHMGAIDGETLNISTGRRLKFPPKNILADVGDARVYNSNVEKTTESVAAAAARIVEKGALMVGLGGDHYITYPLVKGFEAGLAKRYGSAVKLGYIHLDAHLDAYDENDTWGRFYHGSFARRVSELPSFDLKNMAWVGISGSVGVEPYEYLMNNGGAIFSIDDVRARGMKSVVEAAAAIAGEGTDAVYVTIDIDIVDHTYAPGTGSCTFGGITDSQLFEAAAALRELPNIAAIDVVEVNPCMDPTGNTSKLAASVLNTFLEPRLYE